MRASAFVHTRGLIPSRTSATSRHVRYRVLRGRSRHPSRDQRAKGQRRFGSAPQASGIAQGSSDATPAGFLLSDRGHRPSLSLGAGAVDPYHGIETAVLLHPIPFCFGIDEDIGGNREFGGIKSTPSFHEMLSCVAQG